jgi:hypothetical protein
MGSVPIDKNPVVPPHSSILIEWVVPGGSGILSIDPVLGQDHP